jgi:hypothetical protein
LQQEDAVAFHSNKIKYTSGCFCYNRGMASWSTKRRLGYFLVFALGILVVIAIPSFFLFYTSPTCTDGKQNGTEKGVDCGGVCTRLCPADYLAPRVLWGYSMNVVPGLYNSLAYVDNPNQGVMAESVQYSFKLYDDKGLLVAERKGKTSIPAGQKFAVFAGAIKTGERIPARTTFELAENIEWQRSAPLSGLRVLTTEVMEGNEPKAEAKIVNDTVDKTFSSLDAFIVLYDENDNRVAFSKTRIERIEPRETTTLYFTWPSPFVRKGIRTEILFVPN